MATTYQIPSATDPTQSYTVCLKSNTCQCPDYQHRRAAKGEDCKHLRLARAERRETLRLLAGGLEDAELARLLAKYYPRLNPGGGEVWFAILCEQEDRRALPVTPSV